MPYIKESSRGKGLLTFTPADGGKTVEWYTLTCCHCNYVFVVRPGSGKMRGYCPLCDASTCGRPKCNFDATRLGCVPWEKRMEVQESRTRQVKIAERGCDSF